MKVCSLDKWVLFEITGQHMLRGMDTGRFSMVVVASVLS